MDARERTAIEHACARVVLLTATYADRQQPAALADLFCEDGVLVRPNGQLLKGRGAIHAAYAQRPTDRISRHLVTNTLVDVESTSEARALSYVLLWTGSAVQPADPGGRRADAKQIVGEFDDRFLRTAEGWRVTRREARFVLHLGE